MTHTFTTLAPLLSVLAVVFGSVFSFVQWLDVRRREVKQRRWNDYATQLSMAGGFRPDGTKIQFLEQTAAIYQLLEFSEYAFITVRALEVIEKSDSPLWKEWKDLNGQHMKIVLASLRSQKTYARQVKRYGFARQV